MSIFRTSAIVLFLLIFGPLRQSVAQQPGLDAFVEEMKDMTYIGFEETDKSVRVFVRTSDPVKYTVDTSHDHRVVLILDNCRVPVFNNTRALDTQYFAGPVTRVEARPIENPSASVRVEIHLRNAAVMHPTQKDTYLALDFAK